MPTLNLPVSRGGISQEQDLDLRHRLQVKGTKKEFCEELTHGRGIELILYFQGTAMFLSPFEDYPLGLLHIPWVMEGLFIALACFLCVL